MLFGEAGGRTLVGALVAALIALACVLALPAVAGAAEITVNSTADGEDVLPGTDGCLTAAGKCTLRAAIEESNFSEDDNDEINFDEELFDGDVAGTIVIGKSLPVITDTSHIEAECIAPGRGIGPCVGVDGPGATEPALVVTNTEEVEVDGLAITGAETGIEVIGSTFFRARNNWLGVKLDGSAGGNGTGIFLSPGSNQGRIGNEGSESTNVFANNTAVGLDLFGASRARVYGNYFGVKPDGATPAANGEDIEVTAKVGEFEANENAIGTRVSRKALETPECDGGCNVISGSASSGVDLEGDSGEEEGPAVNTGIRGNYVGLDASGSASVPNTGAGVFIGTAPQTSVGGPSPSEANHFSGGAAGVRAGPATPNLVVRGNLIGIAATGAGSLAAPTEGIVVNSEGLGIPPLEALIADNEIAMEAGIGIVQQGLGAWIFNNEIRGGETGIDTTGYSEEHGNLIEGNSVEGTAGTGILVENELNEVRGNEVLGAGGAGISSKGPVPGLNAENLIGGDTAASENLISGSAGAAIEIADIDLSRIEVGRNRGSANGGPFIDLIAVKQGGKEPKGPGEGIKPPVFFEATKFGAVGFDAIAGATVRVFRKASAAPGELESFLGEAVADDEGNWSVAYAGSIPGGTIVAATQTSLGATSELAFATIPADPVVARPSEAKPADETPPQTKIGKGPKKKSHSTTARFKFSSDQTGSTFQCKLDGKKFKGCKSPRKYKNLKPGKHVFKVRAIDPAGNVDGSAAKRKFTVLG